MCKTAQKNIGERYSYSGQCLIPPLQCWCGERQVWDQAMTVGVEDGGTNYLGETAVRLVFMQLLNLVHLFPNRWYALIQYVFSWGPVLNIGEPTVSAHTYILAIWTCRLTNIWFSWNPGGGWSEETGFSRFTVELVERRKGQQTTGIRYPSLLSKAGQYEYHPPCHYFSVN